MPIKIAINGSPNNVSLRSAFTGQVGLNPKKFILEIYVN